MNWEDYGAICRERGSLAMEVFACFTTPAREHPPAPELLAEHLAYQKDLEAQGKLFLAGPLSDESGVRMSGAGLIVYKATDFSEAMAMASADPMHRAGHRCFHLQAWRLNEGAPIPGLRLSERSFDTQ